MTVPSHMTEGASCIWNLGLVLGIYPNWPIVTHLDSLPLLPLTENNRRLPWWSGGWDSALPVQRAWVRSLVGELRAHITTTKPKHCNFWAHALQLEKSASCSEDSAQPKKINITKGNFWNTGNPQSIYWVWGQGRNDFNQIAFQLSWTSLQWGNGDFDWGERKGDSGTLG